jgi:hypothetical protein
MRDLIGLQAQLLLKRSQSPEQETTHELFVTIALCHESRS